MKKPKIEILTEKAGLPAGQEQTVDVLVRITPPPVDENLSQRPKLNLSMVLDRSGSMNGRKIVEARDAAKYCIDQLLATDRISAVIFDDQVDVLIPSQPVENKDLLKRAINSVQVNGSTALHEGWVRGGLQVSDHLEPTAINRVLLITDGQANVGETNVDRIVSQTRELAAKGVSTSTIGIGEDFNEDLLMPMAEAGQGNAWHVQEPQDMVKIFETEMLGLVRQIGHSATLAIDPSSGVEVVEVLNDFEIASNRSRTLPNILAGSVLDVVVRLRVTAGEVGSTAKLAKFTLNYIDQASNASVSIESEFEIKFADAAAVQSWPENVDVAKAVQLLMNARARREAMKRIDQEDFEGSVRVLETARASMSVLFSRIGASPEMSFEASELEDLGQQINGGEGIAMARKRMAYRRESVRKGKS